MDMRAAVLVVLLTAAFVSCRKIGDKHEVVAIDPSKLGFALEQYWVDVGDMPVALDELIANQANEPLWNGPYLKSTNVPVDPWGSEFSYIITSNYVELRSAGPDKLMRTHDDWTFRWDSTIIKKFGRGK